MALPLSRHSLEPTDGRPAISMAVPAILIYQWSCCPLFEAAGSSAHRRWRGCPTENRRKASGALSRGRAAGEGAGARRGWRRLNSCGGVCPNSRIWSSTACSTGQGSSARCTPLSRGLAAASSSQTASSGTERQVRQVSVSRGQANDMPCLRLLYPPSRPGHAGARIFGLRFAGCCTGRC